MKRFDDFKPGDKIRALLDVEAFDVNGVSIKLTAGEEAEFKIKLDDYSMFIAEGRRVFWLSGADWFISQGTTWEAVTGWYEVMAVLGDGKEPEPRNNDGRSACYWCGGQTAVKPGLMLDKYDYCDRCKK